MKIYTALICLFLLYANTACNVRSDAGKTIEAVAAQDSLDFSHDVKLKYAQKLLVENHLYHKEVYILNPLGSDTIATYIFALHNQPLSADIEQKGSVIRVPIKTVVCLSSTQVGALEVLDLREKLIGATNVNRFWDEGINRLIEEGKIREVGVGMKPDNELIVALSPDVLIKNDHSKNIEEREMTQVGITTVFFNDWRENDLLARAEWLKIMGILFCRNMQADSLFNGIENRYKKVRELARTSTEIPDVFIAQDIKGTWFMPGSESYIPSMIGDAHARTKTIEGGVSTSLPCSFEKVYEEHRNDKYWLSLKGGMVATLKDFGAASEHYKNFEAFKSGNVYINNKRVKPQGGNDFWETGTYKPDIILKDLIKIFHPELFPGYETYYWRKLE